jgi:hypothetical protein
MELLMMEDGGRPAGVNEPPDEGGGPAGVVEGFDAPKEKALYEFLFGVDGGGLEEYSGAWNPDIMSWEAFVEIRELSLPGIAALCVFLITTSRCRTEQRVSTLMNIYK